MAVPAPTAYNLDMNADYLDNSFCSRFRSRLGPQPWQVAYRPQISPDIDAENVIIKDSVQISASAAETTPAASAQPPPPPAEHTGAPATPQQIELSTKRVKVVLPPSVRPQSDSAAADGAADSRLREDAALQALTTAYLVNSAFES